MSDGVPEMTERYARHLGPEPDGVIEEMDERAEREGFPTVGPAVGGWFQLLAGLVDAERVFEFGSGFGYSAYWFARALPPDGEVVLTEIDADELDDAREYLRRGDLADRAVFEHGDAIDIVAEYDGPFDAVLIDNEKHRYVEAFEAARSKVPEGGVVVTDNVMAGPIAFEDAYDVLVEGGDPGDDRALGGVVEYVEHVRGDRAFETALLPLGEGVAVSRRVDSG